MKAAFLVRCSTNKQDYERQIEDLSGVAEGYNFIANDDLIFGEHITGKDDTTKGDRISIKRLKLAAEQKLFDVVLIAEVSRLSRDSVSGRVYVRQLCNLHIPVYFRDKGKWTIDLKTGEEDEAFIKELGLYFDGAAEYLKSMKTQIASGRRNGLRNNQLVIGHVPLGYKKLGGTDKRIRNTLVVDLNNSEMVKDIFKMYLQEGATLKSVSLSVTAKYGVKKSISGIQQILARELYYTGEYLIMMNDPDNKNKDPEPFIIKLDSLIDKDTFDKVTKKRNENRSTRDPYPKQKVHLLSRLIKCPICGHSFTPRCRMGEKKGEKYRMINGKIAYSWICMTSINNSGDCNSGLNLSNDKLETLLWELIKKELIDFADMNTQAREEKVEDAKEKIENYKEEVNLMESQKININRTTERAYNAYLSASDSIANIALERYNKTMLDAQRDIEYVNTRVDELKKKIEECEVLVNYYSQPEYSSDYIMRAENDEDEKRKLFLQLIQKIHPYKVRYRVVVLEVYTIDGIKYVLLDGNQRNNKEAYYIDYSFAIWQNSLKRCDAYRTGDYFVCSNPSLIMDSNELEEFVSFEEMGNICINNDWRLYY